MHEFHGNLLIGGMSLKDLDGQIEKEKRVSGANDWLLEGSFHVSPQDQVHLQVGRPYRLLLDDGRAGQVVVDEIKPDEKDSLAHFAPPPKKPK